MKNRVRGNLKKYFLAGLISILPLFATIYVIKFILELAIETLEKILPLQKMVTILIDKYIDDYLKISSIETLVRSISILLSLVIIFIGTFLVGVWINHFINKEKVRYFENLFLKLPLAKPIYTTFKQLSDIIFSKEYKSYKKVVLVEYPRKGIYSLGFLTKTDNKLIQNIVGGEKINNVFIPTSPNPTSGMFIMIPENELIEINLKVEEAFKMIISGGAIVPSEKGLGGKNEKKNNNN